MSFLGNIFKRLPAHALYQAIGKQSQAQSKEQPRHTVDKSNQQQELTPLAHRLTTTAPCIDEKSKQQIIKLLCVKDITDAEQSCLAHLLNIQDSPEFKNHDSLASFYDCLISKTMQDNNFELLTNTLAVYGYIDTAISIENILFSNQNLTIIQQQNNSGKIYNIDSPLVTQIASILKLVKIERKQLEEIITLMNLDYGNLTDINNDSFMKTVILKIIQEDKIDLCKRLLTEKFGKVGLDSTIDSICLQDKYNIN